MSDENRQSVKQTSKPKNTIMRDGEIENALCSVQHLPGCLVITHFFLDVPAKGKDARPVQASRKVSEGAVGVTV